MHKDTFIFTFHVFKLSDHRIGFYEKQTCLKTTLNDNTICWITPLKIETLQQHKDHIAFENDLLKLMQNVTFIHISNNFQDQMKADIESIKRSKNIYILFADKTNNLYETDIKKYNKLLINSISKT